MIRVPTADDFAGCSNEVVREYHAQMQALESFAQAHKLAAAAVMAGRDAVAEDGAASLAQWIEIAGRLGHGAANTQARVATA